MGYSIDQELIAGREYYAQLGSGDIVVLLTCANDFYDVLRRSFSGRSKPWFSLEEGTLRQHPPDITFLNRLRDRSYLAGRMMSLLGIQQGRPLSAREVKQGMDLYHLLVHHELKPLTQLGVHVIVGYHDMTGIPDEVDAKGFLMHSRGKKK